MERTLRDDLKWAVCVLVGVTVGYFVFDAKDPGLLVGAVVGCTVVILALSTLRRVRRPPGRKQS
jgi:uncharacterized membrane protein YfcA